MKCSLSDCKYNINLEFNKIWCNFVVDIKLFQTFLNKFLL